MGYEQEPEIAGVTHFDGDNDEATGVMTADVNHYAENLGVLNIDHDEIRMAPIIL